MLRIDALRASEGPCLARGRVPHVHTRGGINFWGLGAFIKGGVCVRHVLAVSRDCRVTVTLPITLAALTLSGLLALIGGGTIARLHRLKRQDNTVDRRASIGELTGERG